MAAPRPPPIAAPKPAPSRVPTAAEPSAELFADCAAPATCWSAKFLQTSWSSSKTENGLFGAGMTATDGPIGCEAQADSAVSAIRLTAVVLMVRTEALLWIVRIFRGYGRAGTCRQPLVQLDT